MARFSPPQSVLVILGSYLLTAAVVAVMVMEAMQGRWSTLLFGAGCILGFLAGLRVGLSTEEQPTESPLPDPEDSRLAELEMDPYLAGLDLADAGPLRLEPASWRPPSGGADPLGELSRRPES